MVLNMSFVPFRTSQFIVGLNKYLEAVNNKFSVGMRFKMRFEGEDSPERRYPSKQLLWSECHLHCKIGIYYCVVILVRFSGTIVGVGDVSQGWSNSQWRSLKVELYSKKLLSEFFNCIVLYCILNI